MWQAAKEQCDRVGSCIKRQPFRDDSELSSQMNAAALSVMLNISEGFLRRRDKEFHQFLRYALASNGEVKACYYAAQGRKYIAADELEQLVSSMRALRR